MSYDHERRAVRMWLTSNRMTCISDLILDDYVFFKESQPDYFTGEINNIRLKSDMLVLSEKIVSVMLSNSNNRWDDRYTRYWCSSAAEHLSFFDETWVCSNCANFDEIYSNADKRIGIMIFDEYQNLAIVRPAVTRRARNMDHYALAGLLTRAAMFELYAAANDPQPSNTNKKMLKRNAQTIPYDVLRNAVAAHLKRKYYNRLPLPF